MMVAPLIGMAARAAAKKAAEKQATRRAQAGAATVTGVAGALGYDRLMSEAKDDMEQGAAEGKRRAEKNKRGSEAKDEMKRESRGMKSGGYVRAADGCAKKGKTKGKMV